MAEYRSLAGPHLYPAGREFGVVPEAALAEHLDARSRLAALLVLLADTVAEPLQVIDDRVSAGAADDVIARLRRRRLPWDATAARVAIEAAWQGAGIHPARLAAAVDGAEAVCKAGRADAALVEALESLVAGLQEAPVDVWGVQEVLLRVRAVLRSTIPPGLLDLSALGDGDRWAEPAREVARALPADAIAPLVRLLSGLGPRRPAQSWWRAVEEALRPTPAAALVEGWLREAEVADTVPPDPRRLDAGAMLFAPGAEDVVRATVLAARLLDEERVPAHRLGALVRRAAATTSGVPGMTASLALRVAGAGVESLAARGGPTDVAVLEELLEDLTRRDLVRKVGAALSREGEGQARSSEIEKAKARTAARAADPAPRRERAAHATQVRRALTPVLRPLGFTASGGTWRRRHDDRVDVVAVGLRDGDLELEYGTWFDAAHPPDEAWHVPADQVRSWHLDVRVISNHGPVDTAVGRLAEHVHKVVVPFVDGLSRWELVRAWLDHDTGTPRGATPSPRREHLGLLALHVGDADVARQRIAAHVEMLERSPSNGDQGDALRSERQRWRRLLAAAQALQA